MIIKIQSGTAICILQIIILTIQVGGGSTNMPSRHEIPDSLEEITDKAVALITSGNDKIQLEENFKDVVLVIGNTGAGKTTLSMFLTGQKLLAYRIRSRYLITDPEGKISNSSLISKTISPEIFQDEAGTVYYDLPGFSDTRHASVELANAWFKKMVTDHVDQVKILCVVNFSSLRIDSSQTDFMNFLQHMISFVVQPEKFTSSVALLASKVDHFLEDHVVTEDIVEFLNKFKEDIDKLFQEDEDKEKATGIIDTLLQQDLHGNYNRIGFFKQPHKEGEFDHLPYFVERRASLKKMVNDDLTFTMKTEDDFEIGISESAQSYVEGVAEKLNEKFSSLMEELANAMLADSTIIANTLGVQLDTMESKFDHITQRRAFLETLNEELQNVPSIQANLKELLLLDRTVTFFEYLDQRPVPPQILEWLNPLQTAIQQLQTLVPKVTPPSITDLGTQIQEFLHAIFTEFSSSLEDASGQDYETKSAFKSVATRDLNSLLTLPNVFSSTPNLTTFIDRLNSTAGILSFSSSLPLLEIPMFPEENPETERKVESWVRAILEYILQITLEFGSFKMKLQKLKYEQQVQVLNNNISMLQQDLEQQSINVTNQAGITNSLHQNSNKPIAGPVTSPLITQLDEQIQDFMIAIKTGYSESLEAAAKKDYETQSAFKAVATQDLNTLLMLTSIFLTPPDITNFIDGLNSTVPILSFYSSLPPLQISQLPPRDIYGNELMITSWLKAFLEHVLSISLEFGAFTRKLQKSKYEIQIQALNNNITLLQEQQAQNEFSCANQDEVISPFHLFRNNSIVKDAGIQKMALELNRLPDGNSSLIIEMDDQVQEFLHSLLTAFTSSLETAASQDFETQSTFKSTATKDVNALLMLSKVFSSTTDLNTFIGDLNSTAAILSFSSSLPPMQIAQLPDENPETERMVESWGRIFLEYILKILIDFGAFKTKLQKLKYDIQIQDLKTNITMLQEEQPPARVNCANQADLISALHLKNLTGEVKTKESLYVNQAAMIVNLTNFRIEQLHNEIQQMNLVMTDVRRDYERANERAVVDERVL